MFWGTEGCSGASGQKLFKKMCFYLSAVGVRSSPGYLAQGGQHRSDTLMALPRDRPTSVSCKLITMLLAMSPSPFPLLPPPSFLPPPHPPGPVPLGFVSLSLFLFVLYLNMFFTSILETEGGR